MRSMNVSILSLIQQIARFFKCMFAALNSGFMLCTASSRLHTLIDAGSGIILFLNTNMLDNDLLARLALEQYNSHIDPHT